MMRGVVFGCRRPARLKLDTLMPMVVGRILRCESERHSLSFVSRLSRLESFSVAQINALTVEQPRKMPNMRNRSMADAETRSDLSRTDAFDMTKSC